MKEDNKIDRKFRDRQPLDQLFFAWRDNARLSEQEAMFIKDAILVAGPQQELSSMWWRQCLSAGLDKLSCFSKNQWFEWTAQSFEAARLVRP